MDLLEKIFLILFQNNILNLSFTKKNIFEHQYATFDLDNLDHLLHLIEEQNLSGFNITIPYKEQILPLLHSIDLDAKKIGAVNCVKIENQQLIGFNADCLGFQKSIEPLLQKHHQKAVIFGNGGASKAIKYVLEQLNIEYLVVSRSEKMKYENLTQAIVSEHQILINTTPVGTFPNIDEVLPIPLESISKEHLVYDLVYNPEKTLLLKTAEHQGAIIKNGYEMLEIQALESYKIWNI